MKYELLIKSYHARLYFFHHLWNSKRNFPIVYHIMIHNEKLIEKLRKLTIEITSNSQGSSIDHPTNPMFNIQSNSSMRNSVTFSKRRKCVNNIQVFYQQKMREKRYTKKWGSVTASIKFSYLMWSSKWPRHFFSSFISARSSLAFFFWLSSLNKRYWK